MVYRLLPNGPTSLVSSAEGEGVTGEVTEEALEGVTRDTVRTEEVAAGVSPFFLPIIHPQAHHDDCPQRKRSWILMRCTSAPYRVRRALRFGRWYLALLLMICGYSPLKNLPMNTTNIVIACIQLADTRNEEKIQRPNPGRSILGPTSDLQVCTTFPHSHVAQALSRVREAFDDGGLSVPILQHGHNPPKAIRAASQGPSRRQGPNALPAQTSTAPRETEASVHPFLEKTPRPHPTGFGVNHHVGARANDVLRCSAVHSAARARHIVSSAECDTANRGRDAVLRELTTYEKHPGGAEGGRRGRQGREAPAESQAILSEGFARKNEHDLGRNQEGVDDG